MGEISGIFFKWDDNENSSSTPTISKQLSQMDNAKTNKESDRPTLFNYQLLKEKKTNLGPPSILASSAATFLYFWPQITLLFIPTKFTKKHIAVMGFQ